MLCGAALTGTGIVAGYYLSTNCDGDLCEHAKDMQTTSLLGEPTLTSGGTIVTSLGANFGTLIR